MKDRFGKFVHTKRAGRITVRLLLDTDIAATLSERVWHPRQKLTWRRDGRLELAFPVVDLQDILPWVLSLGSHVLVMTPPQLRRMVREQAVGMSKKPLRGAP
jgi:predicted DNA-binding transcriptional regulator YafY